jgi:hypothetical protein
MTVTFTPSSPNKVPIPARTRADIRQSQRLATALEQVSERLGKSTEAPKQPIPTPKETRHFCSNNIEDYLPDTFQAHEDWCSNPALIHVIQRIITNQSPPKTVEPFQWSMTNETKHHNANILQTFNYNVQKCIDSYPNSIINPGSEFRPINDLEKLYSKHPNWEFIQKNLKRGADMLGDEIIPPTSVQQENEEMIKYNNHKRARSNSQLLHQTVMDDINKGFSISLPIGTEKLLPEAMICPVGIVEQKSYTTSGHLETKQRLTHDQTFSILPQSTSVNDMTDLTRFPEMLYGWCLSRVIHQIVAFRTHFPDKRIIGIKRDFKSAYRRIHYDGKSAQQCLVSFDNSLIMMLRLCFGGAGCPPTWCSFGGMIVDLASQLLHTKEFEPTQTITRYTNKINTTVKRKTTSNIAQAQPMMFLPPP